MMISKCRLKKSIERYQDNALEEIDADGLAAFLFDDMYGEWMSKDKMLPVRLLAAVQVIQQNLVAGVAGSEMIGRMLSDTLARCSLWENSSQTQATCAAVGESDHHALAEGLVGLATTLLKERE